MLTVLVNKLWYVGKTKAQSGAAPTAPAKWKTISGLTAAKTRRAVARSAMSACHQIGPPALLSCQSREVA
jgi:hypothetical protein